MSSYLPSLRPLATTPAALGFAHPVAADAGPLSRDLAGYTVYLGGSFDPAHWGHVRGGWALLMQDAAELWLAPTATHADKKNLCPYSLRLDQCRAVAAEIDQRLPLALRGRIHVSDIEERIDSGGQTVRVFEHLAEHQPQRKFAFAMGSDCLAKAPSWKGWDRLQQLARVVVLDRPGYPGSHEALVAVPMPDVSSTSIRARLGTGRPVDDLVPPAVASLIAARSLYPAVPSPPALTAALQPPEEGSTSSLARPAGAHRSPPSGWEPD